MMLSVCQLGSSAQHHRDRQGILPPITGQRSQDLQREAISPTVTVRWWRNYYSNPGFLSPTWTAHFLLPVSLK